MTDTQWTSKPSDEQIQQRIVAFMGALATAELERAFAICPCDAFDPANKEAMFEHLEHAMFQFMIISKEGAEEAPVLEKPETWLSGITPPPSSELEALQLEISGDEVMANVFIDGEVTDITARYRLEEKDQVWRLHFENLDIM